MNKLPTSNHQETAETPWPALLGHFEETLEQLDVALPAGQQQGRGRWICAVGCP
jgi:hypothetical protein